MAASHHHTYTNKKVHNNDEDKTTKYRILANKKNLLSTNTHTNHMTANEWEGGSCFEDSSEDVDTAHSPCNICDLEEQNNNSNI